MHFVQCRLRSYIEDVGNMRDAICMEAVRSMENADLLSEIVRGVGEMDRKLSKIGTKMTYTVDGVAYDSNSSINQRIKGTLVEREVMANVSDMMCDLIWYSYDDAHESNWGIDNFDNGSVPCCPECGDRGLRKCDDNDIPTIADRLGFGPDDVNPRDHSICTSCGAVIWEDECDWDSRDPYEYWIVSPWFGDQLLLFGEMVLKRDSGAVWGRCTTGQAIALDYVVDQIAYRMGILDGQKASWAKVVA